MITKVSNTQPYSTRYNLKISFAGVKFDGIKPSSVPKISDASLHIHDTSFKDAETIIGGFISQLKEGVFSFHKYKSPSRGQFVAIPGRYTTPFIRSGKGVQMNLIDGMYGEAIEIIAKKEANWFFLPTSADPLQELRSDKIIITRKNNEASYDVLKAEFLKLKHVADIKLLQKLSNDFKLNKFILKNPEIVGQKDLAPDAKFVFESKHHRKILVSQDKKTIEYVSRKGKRYLFTNKQSTDDIIKPAISELIANIDNALLITGQTKKIA